MQSNDTEFPAPPRSLFIDGVEVTEGSYVTMQGDSDDEAGEVWAVDSQARVFVSWPIPTGSGFRYSQDWHPLGELRVVES
jgi:hypothetical protein